ncbi:SGNH/GDSL hydrolase family protein [Roseomonas sp. GCM10028921]
MSVFKVITIGDSVAWGQGLMPEQKFDRLAALDIAAAIRAGEFLVENRAHSGATIGLSDQGALDVNVLAWQEVPNGAPTVLDQIRADDWDANLVILVAGINDINFREILNPTALSDTALDARIQEHCFGSMRSLLAGMRGQFPRALIVVAGYYPMLSEESELDVLRLAAALLALPFSPLAVALLSAPVVKRATRRIRRFQQAQLHWLRRAVADVQADPGLRGPGILFAHPAFGPRNSVGAPGALLFGPQRPESAEAALAEALESPLATGLMIDPKDPQEQPRRAACAATRTGAELVTCRVASIGHPNQAGARRYADAVVRAVLRDRRMSLRDFLSSHRSTEPLLSLNQALRRHRPLAKNGSVRTLIRNEVIDSIALEVRTRNAEFAGTDHPVYLRLGPGKEWLLNESLVGGDLANDFEPGQVSWYFIDPAEGKLDGRLRLQDLTEFTLELRFSVEGALGGDWGPEAARLAINGQEVLAVEIGREFHVNPGRPIDAWTVPLFPRKV